MPEPRRPAPQPLDTDVVPVITAGTALWVVALAVTLLLHDRLADDGRSAWVWVCLAGVGLGFLGIWHVRRRRDALVRSPESDPSATDTGPNPS